MTDSVLEALDLIAVPAFVIDVMADEVVVFRRINKAHEAMTGLLDADIAHRTPAQVFPARLAETLVENYLAVVRSGKPSSYEELLDLAKGEEWWQTTLMPVLDEAGRVVRIIGTGINISDRKRVEIERAETLARAFAINEEIEETLALAAHDLKSPLVNIQAMVREMKRDFVDLKDGKAAILDHIEAIGMKASSFVDDMLRYRDTAAVLPAVSRFDVGHAVSDIVALLDPMSRHFIHFNHIDIESDALAVQIVLRNLVDNSIRHADRRDLIVAIDLSENEAGTLTFTVADNGNGLVRPEEIEDDAASSRPGHGYGLRGVRRLVRSRGGDVWVGTPLFSSGATVHFSLPGRIVGERMPVALGLRAA